MKPRNPTVGTRLYFTGSYRDLDGRLTDPPTATCTVKSPSGVVAVPPPYRIHAGVWRAEWVVNEPGWWSVVFTGSGPSPVEVAGARRVLVIPI